MTLYIDTRPTLEWVGYTSLCDYGEYQIAESKPHGKFRAIMYYENNEVEWCSIIYDTIDQAKAAAQADYEARTAERFRAVEVLPEDVTLHDLKRLRNYFGVNDKTLFEHKAYAWLDSLIKHIAKAKEIP
jgi:hypothetical protein